MKIVDKDPPSKEMQELIALGGEALDDPRPVAQCYVAQFFREVGLSAWVALRYERRGYRLR